MARKRDKSPDEEQESTPWYRDGLQFTCTQCGDCCGGAPGQVWISDAEITALAAHLHLDEPWFRLRYTVRDGRSGVSLAEKGRSENYRCVFYQPGAGCTVYEHRPAQCRSWPFWRSVVRSEATWNEHSRGCPGMDTGTVHTADIIATTVIADGINDL